MPKGKNIEGLRGWLILVGIGLVLTPFRISSEVLPTYSKLLSSEAWQILTTPGTEAYNPFFAPLVIGEIATNFALVCMWLYLALLFFSKRAVFPKLYIFTVTFSLFFILLDSVLFKLIFPNSQIFDPATTKELARALPSIIIWVPYMLLSKRVKATFTQPGAKQIHKISVS